MNAATRPVLHASMMLTALDKITVHQDPAFTDLGATGDIEDNNYMFVTECKHRMSKIYVESLVKKFL